jgi:DNA-binding CsgD family transcriptional regulator
MKWTPELDKRLEELFNQGLSDTEISKVLNAAVYAVKTERSRLGLKKHKGMDRAKIKSTLALAQEEKTPQEIAQELQISTSYVYIILRTWELQNGELVKKAEACNPVSITDREFTPITDMLIMQFLAEGYSTTQIAYYLRRSKKAVDAYIKTHTKELKRAHNKMMREQGVYYWKLIADKKQFPFIENV